MPLRTVAVVLAALLLAGCSSTRPTAAHRPGAAEPANAPSATLRPVGWFASVGDKPEGIAYDARTDTVAVAVRNPSRLVLLDGARMTVRRSVALPGVVRHLQMAGPGGPVLVPCESADELVEVPLDGTPIRATKVGRSPHDATATSAGYVAGDEFGPSLSVVRNGRLVRTISGQGIEQPGGVIGDGPTVALVDVHAFTVSTFDVATGKRIAVVAAGKGPTHGVLDADHHLIVADTRGNQLLTYSLSPLRETGHLDLAGAPYGIASDPSQRLVWVTLTGRNQVVGFDVSGATPREIARYATVEQPNTVAVAPGSGMLWITGTRTGVVQQIKR